MNTMGGLSPQYGDPCEWYARCGGWSVLLVWHPVLGWVPVCQNCVDRHGLVDTHTTRELP